MKKKDTNLLVLGRSDPSFALEDAFPSDVFFPNDDYPPGFPCTSGCGKKFPTVIMQEIHIQHYCKGPYDEIESCLETSVAAFKTPSTSSDDDHDGIPQLPSSPGTSELELNAPAIPAVDNSKDVQCPLCGKYLASRRNLRRHMASHDSGSFLCPVEKCLYHSAKSQGALDLHVRKKHPAVAEQREGERSVIDLDGIPRLPSSLGTSQLEPDPPAIPSHGAVPVDRSEDLKCLVCGRYLATRPDFKYHMALHNWEHILCSVRACRYSARSQYAMDLHMRVCHLAVTDERKGEILACCHCGRNMYKKDQLRRHLRHHDSGKFPCPIDNCSSQVMSTLEALNLHLNFHHANLQRRGSLLGTHLICSKILLTVISGNQASGQGSRS